MPVTHVPVSIAAATTAYTVLADSSGLTHYIADLTGSCTFTLPTPKAGLWFEFVYSGGAADAQNWIIDTGSDTNFFVGGVSFLDTDAGDAADEVHLGVYSDGNSNSKLTVVVPAAGTRVKVESTNGTTWHVSGIVIAATVPTMADQ